MDKEAKDFQEETSHSEQERDTAISNNEEGEFVEENQQGEDRLRDELDELKDKYLRLTAEFDNYRKRTARERLDMVQTAGREVITYLLEVLDDAERAEKQLEQSSDVEAMREGLMLVFGKLRSLLQSRGLKPMESVGQPFNTDLHEAITEIPAPSAEFQGKIVDEIQKGYYLNDKIIRHAKVVVGK